MTGNRNLAATEDAGLFRQYRAHTAERCTAARCAIVRIPYFCLVALLFLFCLPSPAQRTDPAPLRIDATATPAPAGPADYAPGASRAPNGSTLGVTDRYLTRDGKPWLPVMGELHYSRVPESEWETEILKMKAAGVEVISSYIIWIHHEEVKGEWDWSGQRDLRHFAEL